MNLNMPIGVFDSGMGGLSVLKALKKSLPTESFLYLGDTARLPYGTKSIETVQHYAKQMANVLMQRKIKALVIACNTATTAALSLLQNIYSELPVIGVLNGGASAAATASKNHKIYILATETTIASQGYQQKILARVKDAKIKAKAANVLVALAEEGISDSPFVAEAFKHYLHDLTDEDTLLLGCTHFPVFMPFLANLLPGVTLIDPAYATAEFLQHTLGKYNILNTTLSPTIKYLVTDSVNRFKKVGSIFLGESLENADVELVNGF